MCTHRYVANTYVPQSPIRDFTFMLFHVFDIPAGLGSREPLRWHYGLHLLLGTY